MQRISGLFFVYASSPAHLSELNGDWRGIDSSSIPPSSPSTESWLFINNLLDDIPRVAKKFPYIIANISLYDPHQYDLRNQHWLDLREIAFTALILDNGSFKFVDYYPGVSVKQIEENKEVKLTGPVVRIQRLLDDGGLQYLAVRKGWEGRATIELTIEDVDSKEKSTSSTTIGLIIEKSQEEEMILKIAPTNMIIDEDEILPFSTHDISLSIDGVSTHHYLECSFLTASQSTLSTSQSNGSPSNVMRDFSSIVYYPTKNFYGIDTVMVECTDSKGEFQESTLLIYLSPVNDLPQIVLPSRSFTLSEDEEIKFGVAASLYFLDVDCEGAAAMRATTKTPGMRSTAQLHSMLAVSLSISSSGFFHFPSPDKLGGLYTSSSNNSHLHLVGHVEKVNMALQEIMISFDSNWYGPGSISIQFTGTIDNTHPYERYGYDNWQYDSVDFIVESVNDPPNVYLNHEVFLNLNEEDVVQLSPDVLRILDVDSTADNIQVTLDVHREVGKHSNVFPAPVRFVINSGNPVTSINHTISSSSRGIAMSGTISDILVGLQSITMVMEDDWFGTLFDGFIISVTDSLGGKTIKKGTIIVSPLDDPPVVYISHGNMTVLEDTSVLLSSSVQISVHDNDSVFEDATPSNIYIGSVSSTSDGIIRLSEFIPGCYIISGNAYGGAPKEGGVNSSQLLFQGSIEIINKALSSISYTPKKEYDGSDDLTVRIEDESGLFDQKNIHIEIHTVNDPPVLASMYVELDYQTNNQTKAIVKGIVVSDVDNGDEIMTISIQLLPKGVARVEFPYLVNTLRRRVEFIERDFDEMSLKGYADDINDAVKEVWIVNIQSHEYTQSTVIVRAIDAEGSSTERSLLFDLPLLRNIPKMKVPNYTLECVEDQSISIGSSLSIEKDPSSRDDDFIFEVDISSPIIVVLDGYKIIFNDTCADQTRMRGSFIISFGNEKSRDLSIFATSEKIETELQEFSSISRAKVIKENNADPSFELHLSVFVKMNITKWELSQSLNVFIANMNNEDPCTLDVKRRIMDKDTKDRKYEIWQYPEERMQSFFHFVDYAFGGIHFPYNEHPADMMDSIVMRGDVESLNSALRKIIYHPPKDFFGETQIVFRMRSFSGTINDDQFQEESISIIIDGVDDDPYFTWDGLAYPFNDPLLELDEDSIDRFGPRLHIRDIDIGLGQVSFTIGASEGLTCFSIDLPDAGIVVVEGTLNVTNSIFGFQNCNSGVTMITGLLKDINEAIHSISYLPSRDWWGLDQIKISVSGTTNEKVINVHVRSVIDNPSLHFESTTLYTEEDTILFINDTFITDVDVKENDGVHEWHSLKVELKVSHGSIGYGGGESFVKYKNPYYFHGTLESTNHLLKKLLYKPNNNFYGKDHLEILAYSPTSGGSATETAVIHIESINDPPRVIAPENSIGLREDTIGIIGAKGCSKDDYHSYLESLPSIISCQSISIHDIDGGYSNSTERSAIDLGSNQEDENVILVSLSSPNGTFRLPHLMQSYNNIEVLSNTSDLHLFMKQIQLKGDLISMNHILHSLHFKGDANFNSEIGALEQIIITAQDNMGAVGRGEVQIHILPVNDHPVIHVTGEHSNMSRVTSDGLSFLRTHCDPISLHEDTIKHVTGIQVRDVDCNSAEDIIEMRLACSNGMLLIDKNAHIQHWISGEKGEFYSILRFRSSIEDVNRALQYLVYKPFADFNGKDELMVIISDNGNSGLDPSSYLPDTNIDLIDSVGIPIHIESQEDAAVIAAPSYYSLQEDIPIELTISLFHPDSNSTRVIVTFDCGENGSVRLPPSALRKSDITFLNETANDRSLVVAVGTVYDWNDVLKQLLYIPKQDWNTHHSRWEELQIIVTNAKSEKDLSASPTASHIMLLNIKAKNDQPEWIIPGRNLFLQDIGGYMIQSVDPIVLNEDEEAVISPVSIHDPDSIRHDENIVDFFVTVRLESTFGYIKLVQVDGLYFIQGENNSPFMEFRALYSMCNKAVSHLTYIPYPHFHGKDMIHLFVSDDGNVGDDIILSSNISIPMTVVATIDIPVIVTPQISTCGKESWCNINNVNIIDPDLNDELYIELTSRFGASTFSGGFDSQMRSVRLLEGSKLSSGDSYLKLSGNALDLNHLLQSIAYLPTSAASVDWINFTVWLPSENNDSMAKPVTSYSSITSVIVFDTKNNHPWIRYTGATYYDDIDCLSSYHATSTSKQKESTVSTESLLCKNVTSIDPIKCLEDIACRINGLSVEDPDSSVLMMVLGVDHGYLSYDESFASSSGIHSLIDTEEESQSKRLILKGSSQQINTVLNAIEYTSERNYVGIDVLHTTLSDLPQDSDPTSITHEMHIDVIISSVEDQIYINGPHVYDVFEDSFLSIDGIKITHEHHISWDDLVFVSAKIHISGGVIRLGSSDDIKMLGTSYYAENQQDILRGRVGAYSLSEAMTNDARLHHKWWSNLMICGRLADINKALGNLTFIANENWNSKEQEHSKVLIYIQSVNECVEIDVDNIHDSISILVHVHPVNDAPTVMITGYNGTYSKMTSEEEKLHMILFDETPFHEDNMNVTSFFQTKEDTELKLSVKVGDVDDEILTVELFTNGYGYLSVVRNEHEQAYGYGDIMFIEGNCDNSFYDKILMKGTIHALNLFLSNIHFLSKLNYHGNDTVVQINVFDDVGAYRNTSVPIVVTKVLDRPELWMTVDQTLQSPPVIIDEGDRVKLASTWFHASDFMEIRIREDQVSPLVDDGLQLRKIQGARAFSLSNGDDHSTSSTFLLCIKLQVNKGYLTIDPLPTNVLIASSDYVSVPQGEKISLLGPIQGLNEVAESIYFTTEEGDAGNDARFSVSVAREVFYPKLESNEEFPQLAENCPGALKSTLMESSFQIIVVPVNSAPIIRWYGNKTNVTEVNINETSMIIGLSVFDNDINENQVIDSHQRSFEGYFTVTITVSRGAIRLASLRGLSFVQVSGVGTEFESMLEFYGSQDDVNTAIAYIEYMCHDCILGTIATLQLSLSDNGFSGKGEIRRSNFELLVLTTDMMGS